MSARGRGGRGRRVGDAPPAAAFGDRELVRSRRALPHVPLPDVRDRPVPVPVARPPRPLGHASARRPHDRRRRRAPRSHASTDSPTSAAGSPSTAAAASPIMEGIYTPPGIAHTREMLDSAMRDRLWAFTIQGEDLPQADEPHRPRSVACATCTAFPPGARRTTCTRTRSSRRATTRPKLEAIMREAGAESTFAATSPPLDGDRAGRRSASMSRHIMGTCRMGDDPATSVVDPWQRFHDVENMVCTDSSVFPTSTGYGPTLTIVALAIRACRDLAGLPKLTSARPALGSPSWISHRPLRHVARRRHGRDRTASATSGTTSRSCWCSSGTSVDCTAASMPRSCVSATTRSRPRRRHRRDRHRRPPLRRGVRPRRADPVPRARRRRRGGRARGVAQDAQLVPAPPPAHVEGNPRRRRSAATTSTRPGKRVKQIGATFVIGAGDGVRYEHIDTDSTDHAQTADVLATLA